MSDSEADGEVQNLDLQQEVLNLKGACQLQSSQLEMAGCLHDCIRSLLKISKREQWQSSLQCQWQCFMDDANNDRLSSKESISSLGMVLRAPDMHGKCTVQDVLPGSPVYLCGKIKPGDSILQVDGEGVEPNNIVDKIKGNDIPGSRVLIQVVRPGRKRPVNVNMLRASMDAVDFIGKTFEVLEKLAQLVCADDGKNNAGGLAESLEKKLRTRLITMEQERIQREIVIQEKEDGNMRMLAAVKEVVLGFIEIIAKDCDNGAGEPAGYNRISIVPSAGTGPLREVVLQIGRASKFLETSFLALDSRFSNEWKGLHWRLLRADRLCSRMSLHFKSLKECVGNDQLQTSYAMEEEHETAAETVHLQGRLDDCEDKLRKARQQNTELFSQVESYEMRVLLLESQVQIFHQHCRNTAPAPSTELNGLGSNKNKSTRPADDVEGLNYEVLSQVQMKRVEMERDRRVPQCTSALVEAHNRALSGASDPTRQDIGTHHAQNQILKEQWDEVVIKKDSYNQLEPMFMQGEHKRVETEKLQKSVELEKENEEMGHHVVKEQYTIESLQGMLRHRAEELSRVNATLADVQWLLKTSKAQTKASKQSFGASEHLRRTLEDKYVLSERMRKKMEEVFNREREDGMQVFRELDTVKSQLDSARNEIQRLRIAKDQESADTLRDEWLRWKRNFEMAEIKFKDECEMKLSEHVRHLQKDTLHEQLRMEIDEKRREVLEAQKEKDLSQREKESLKAEIDECRYVMGLLTTEVSELRIKVNGTTGEVHNIQPREYTLSPNQASGLQGLSNFFTGSSVGRSPQHDPQAPALSLMHASQRHGGMTNPDPCPSEVVGHRFPQLNNSGCNEDMQRADSFHFLERADSQAPAGVFTFIERADSVYSQASAVVSTSQQLVSSSPIHTSPQHQQSGDLPPSVPQSAYKLPPGHGSAQVPAKPVGVYSNRAGRLFAL